MTTDFDAFLMTEVRAETVDGDVHLHTPQVDSRQSLTQQTLSATDT